MVTDLMPLPAASTTSTELVALPRLLLTQLTVTELAEWGRLKEWERDRIKGLYAAFEEIEATGRRNLLAVCDRVAPRIRKYMNVGHVAKTRLRRICGTSGRTLYKLFKKWLAGARRWQSLLCNYNCGKKQKGRKFETFFIGLVGESSRADAVIAARERLVFEFWFKNQEIPGYGRISEWWRVNRPGLPLPLGRIERPGDVPEGWSLTNLTRLLPRRKATRKLMREGFFAAHGDMPQLLRDRTLLRPLELIAFDDVRLDLQTVFFVNGEWQTAYINAMFALDVRTGRILNYGLKPRWQRDDKTRVAITRAEVRFLLLRILEGIGLPPWTVNILLENSSAALVSQDKEHIQTVLGDRIAFDTTGMMRRQLLKSGFLEQDGMPWQHGWIEAYFRKLHGAIAHLDGATGRRYELDPGDRAGREQYALAVLKRAEAEGRNTGDLWLPFLRHEEAERVVAELVERLNWRTKHKLQGFVDVFEYHHPARGWLDDRDFMALTASEREICKPDARREAPQECFDRGLHGIELTRPPAMALLPLYEDRRPVKIRGGKVTVSGLENDALIFWEEKHPILRGDEYQARELVGIVANDRSCIHLLTPELSFLGTVAREGMVHPLDKDELGKKGGAIHRDRQAIANEAAGYLAPREARYAAGRAQNEKVFAEAAAVGEAMQQGEQAARKVRTKKTAAQSETARSDADLTRRLLAQQRST